MSDKHKFFIASLGYDVPQGDALLEHDPLLHIDTKLQLEAMVFRDEVPLARTEGLAEALEELSEPGHISI